MVEQFELGVWLLFLVYVTSLVGATIGLACAHHARTATGGTRIGWLALAALSIGGVGIWLMHFIAMLGFDTPGTPVRYDIGRTAISAALSIAAVFFGLMVFGVRTKFSLWRLLLGGLIMGLAVNLMHYTGMWAVQIQGVITYNSALVWLSIAIAVVAATAALWFTVLFNSVALRVLAGAIMGVAVVGMHYTGMAAVEVSIDARALPPDGAEVFTFLFPVFVLAVLALAVPIYAVLMASTWNEREDIPVPPREPDPLRALSQPQPRMARHTTGGLAQGLSGMRDLAAARKTEQQRNGAPQPAEHQL
jgi:NO-binding membrane sensor protein with MHYT domain